jgi:hypothetical protein
MFGCVSLTERTSPSAQKLTVTEVRDGARTPVELEAPDGCRPSQRELVAWSLRRCPGAKPAPSRAN